MALEQEIARWRRFREALASEEEKEAFDALMDMCRANATAGSNATNPIIFEPMIMSIALGLQKSIRRLEKKLEALHKPARNENYG
jgi:hypothetical protein